MPAVTLSWHGQAEQDAIFAKLMESALPAMAAALHETQAPAFTESQALVPVVTGRLKRSGQHPPPEWEGRIVTDIISYGSSETKPKARPTTGRNRRTSSIKSRMRSGVGYEVYVHEGHGRGRKFLETPIMENMSGWDTRLGEAFSAGLEGAEG